MDWHVRRGANGGQIDVYKDGLLLTDDQMKFNQNGQAMGPNDDELQKNAYLSNGCRLTDREAPALRRRFSTFHRVTGLEFDLDLSG